MLFGIGWGVPCCQATLKSAIENRKKTKTRIGNPLIKENKFCKDNVCGKLLCKLFPLKIRESQVKESSNKNFLSVEICATLISSEGFRI